MIARWLYLLLCRVNCALSAAKDPLTCNGKGQYGGYKWEKGGKRDGWKENLRSRECREEWRMKETLIVRESIGRGKP